MRNSGIKCAATAVCYNPAMRGRITIVCVVLILAAVVLLWPSQEERLTADEELERLVAGITDGQTLYFRSVEYKRPDPDKIPLDSPLWTPETVRSEYWYAQDSNGEIILYTAITRALDGRIVGVHRLEDGQMVSYYLLTGAQVWFSQGPVIGDSIPDWLRLVWPLKVGDWYTEVEPAYWQGQPVAVWESRTATFTGPQLVYVYEYVVDRPLLRRQAVYEEDETGERTLIDDYRVVEYRLLPKAGIPEVQVTPCVEDMESLRASTCIRLGIPD